MSQDARMSRRRFLAITAGAVGASVISGIPLLVSSARRQPSTDLNDLASTLSGEIIEIEEGFIDAASWNGQLLTLRNDLTTGGIGIRNESTGEEHHVSAPPNFSARSVGSVENSVVIGGHQLDLVREHSAVRSGDYAELLRLSGAESAVLSQEPMPQEIFQGQIQIVGRIPTIGYSDNMDDWEFRAVSSPDIAGGSVGAVLEQSGTLVLENYLEPHVPDSIYEIRTVKAARLVRGETPATEYTLPIDHGFVWGVSYLDDDEFLLLYDWHGITGYSRSGTEILRITDGSLPISITGTRDSFAVTRVTPDGLILADAYRDGDLVATSADDQDITPIYSLTTGWHVIESGIREAAVESTSQSLNY